MKKNRVVYIDSVKGIAISLVIIGHIITMHDNPLFIWIYSFHMPVFFIISGLIQSITYKDNTNYSFRQLFVKKFKSIIYPYVVFSFLAILCIFFRELLHKSFSNTIDAVFKTITLLGYSALWFLPCFFITELLFCLIIGLKNKSFLRYIIAIGIFLSTVFGTIWDFRDLLGDFNSMYYFIGRILVGLTFMFCGFFVHQIRKRFSLLSNKIVCGLIGVGLIVIDCFTSQLNPQVDLHYFYIGNPILYYLNGFIGSYGLILVAEAFLNNTKFISFLGRNSLIIMMTHLPLPVLMVINKAVNLLPINQYVKYGLVFVICVASECLIVFIINKYLRFLISFDSLKK